MSSLVLISNLFSSFPSGPRKEFAVCMRKSINSKIFDHHLHHQIPRLALKRYSLFSKSSTFFCRFKASSSFNPRSTFFQSLGNFYIPSLIWVLFYSHLGSSTVSFFLSTLLYVIRDNQKWVENTNPPLFNILL